MRATLLPRVAALALSFATASVAAQVIPANGVSAQLKLTICEALDIGAAGMRVAHGYSLERSRALVHRCE